MLGFATPTARTSSSSSSSPTERWLSAAVCSSAASAAVWPSTAWLGAGLGWGLGLRLGLGWGLGLGLGVGHETRPPPCRSTPSGHRISSAPSSVRTSSGRSPLSAAPNCEIRTRRWLVPGSRFSFAWSSSQANESSVCCSPCLRYACNGVRFGCATACALAVSARANESES